MKIEHAIIILAMASILIMSGCVRDTQPMQPGGGNQPTGGNEPSGGTGLKTCTGLGGHECTASEECDGTWLEASDSFSCCSQECTPVVDDSEILDIDPFEPSEENEELGDLS